MKLTKQSEMKHFLAVIALSIFTLLSANGQGNGDVTYVQTPKNPAAAFFLSATFPGTGQMYNGQVELGLRIIGSEAILVGGGLLLISNEGGHARERKIKETLGYGLIGLAGAVHVYQIIQAPLYSDKLNEKFGFNDIALTVHPSTDGIQLGVVIKW